MKIKRGCTRIVFIFEKVVVKIPNFTYHWNNFLKGLISNMTERDIWRWNSGQYEKGLSHLLCPVLWSMRGGFLIVMKRAETDVFEKLEEDISFYGPWIEAGFGGDDKVDNYGILNGTVVKIDYGQY